MTEMLKIKRKHRGKWKDWITSLHWTIVPTIERLFVNKCILFHSKGCLASLGKGSGLSQVIYGCFLYHSVRIHQATRWQVPLYNQPATRAGGYNAPNRAGANKVQYQQLLPCLVKVFWCSQKRHFYFPHSWIQPVLHVCVLFLCMKPSLQTAIL